MNSAHSAKTGSFQATFDGWHSLIIGVGLACILVLLIMSLFTRKEKWMETATLPMEAKVIGIYDDSHGVTHWLLVPDSCIDSSLHVKESCLDYAIELPIKP